MWRTQYSRHLGLEGGLLHCILFPLLFDLEYLQGSLHAAFERKEFELIQNLLCTSKIQRSAFQQQTQEVVTEHNVSKRCKIMACLKTEACFRRHLYFCDGDHGHRAVASRDKVHVDPVRPGPSQVAGHSTVAEGIPAKGRLKMSNPSSREEYYYSRYC